MTTTAEYEKQIDTQFPNLAALYRGIPDLWNVLVWSVAAGLGPQQAQEAIQNTTYYKTHNDKQQAWDALAATDPAQARRLQEQAQHQTLILSAQLGANLTMDQIGLFSQQAVENGFSAQELQDSIVGYMHDLPTAKIAPGAYTAAVTKVRSIANEYAIPVGSKQAGDLAERYLLGGAGTTDEAALGEVFKQQAKSLYPTLAKQLDAGTTVAQWSAPYKQVAANELGIAPESITFNDPKWKAMLDGSPTASTTDNPKAEKPLSLAEWQTKIRTDSQYGFDHTTNGVAASANIAQGLAQMFGKEG